MGSLNLKARLPYALKHPLISSTRSYMAARGLPAQSTKDISLIKGLLSEFTSDTIRVWEWGTGRSTTYYAKFLSATGRAFEWHAIDNNRSWFDKCNTDISRTIMASQVHLHCCEFPAFWELPGYTPSNPVPPDFITSHSNVSDYVDMPNTVGGPFDLMIVDGRYRRRCLSVAREVMSHDGVVLLHDAQRAHYHSSLDIFPHVRFLLTGSLPATSQQSTVALCTMSDNLANLQLPGKFGKASNDLPNRGIGDPGVRQEGGSMNAFVPIEGESTVQ